jgi:hypothetical protein
MKIIYSDYNLDMSKSWSIYEFENRYSVSFKDEIKNIELESMFALLESKYNLICRYADSNSNTVYFNISSICSRFICLLPPVLSFILCSPFIYSFINGSYVILL